MLPTIDQDRGFAWVILGIAFLANVLEASVFISPAVYMVAWDNSFDVTTAQLGTTGSLVNGFMCLVGCFIGPMVNRFGCRPPALVGALICAAGFAASTLATNIQWLYLTYGCIAGFGSGLFSDIPMIYVQYYFKKKRPFALGTSMAGHSVGSLLFIPAIQYFTQLYGWRNVMLMHAGCILQLMVLCSVFKPVEVKDDKETQYTDGHQKDKRLSLDQLQYNAVSEEFENNASSHICIFKSSDENETQMDEIADETYQTKSSDEKATQREDRDQTYQQVQTENSAYKDIQQSGAETIATQSKHKSDRPKTRCFRKVLNLWNWALLKNKAFVVLLVNIVAAEYALGLLKFTPMRAKSEGVSEQDAAFLVSIMAVCSLLMRFTGSVIANLPKVNPSIVTGCSIVGIGLVCCLSSLAYDFPTYALFSIFFGLCTGSFWSTVFTVMTNIVGIQNVPQAFSLVNAFSAIPLFTTLSIGGFIVDISGSYDVTFYIYGAATFIPGLLMIFMSCIFPNLNLTNRNSKKKTATNDIASDRNSNCNKDH